MVVIRIVVGVLLLAHGLVHLLYLARDVPEFSLASSWLVPESVRRPVALALMVTTVAAFVLVALALWGVPGLSRIWPALTIAAASLSLVLLVAFWAGQLADPGRGNRHRTHRDCCDPSGLGTAHRGMTGGRDIPLKKEHP
jgi:hypothetical protein